MQLAAPLPTSSVPVFFLYGEPRREVGPRYLHLEALQDRSVPNNWNIRPHAHADLNHVFFIKTGQGRMTADGVTQPFTSPCLLLVPAGVVHGFAYEPGTVGTVCTLASFYLQDLVAREPDFAGVFAAARGLPLAEPAGFEDRLSRLGLELVWNAPGHAAAVESHLLAILVELLRLSGQAQPVRPVAGRAAEIVARFRALIENSYRTSAPLHDYTAQLRITPAQLRRACLQAARQPPASLIQDRVFLEAQRILLYTNMTVAEAADYLGFADSAYFTRFFTKRAGRSPRNFRRDVDHERSADPA